MNIESVIALAREKAELSKIEPWSSREKDKGFAVEFRPHIVVTESELTKFEENTEPHLHLISACKGCKELAAAFRQHGIDAANAEHEKKKPKPVTKEEILNFLNSQSWTPSKEELADWLFRKMTSC